jgi:hypothetical protein
MGPFFINSILCVLFCTAAFLPVWVLNISDPFGYFFAWLGLSMGMNAFPSTGRPEEHLGDGSRESEARATCWRS